MQFRRQTPIRAKVGWIGREMCTDDKTTRIRAWKPLPGVPGPSKVCSPFFIFAIFFDRIDATRSPYGETTRYKSTLEMPQNCYPWAGHTYRHTGRHILSIKRVYQNRVSEYDFADSKVTVRSIL